ncbi:Storkhead-box protein 1 [Pseudolycoriella hygida]|uniref:Storkhead-box protein 1 n=1 Tax=Pseudolycoriella hygida TaxID=35572 RepID=A0A9Q0N444_9DIPT|nr:Storkhead-box protein 1 [Pseudolycoriella hygida]
MATFCSARRSGTPQRCHYILQHCLAIQLNKPGHVPEDFWMYDSGYMIFQNFLAANAQCWWNGPLIAATRALKYAGHVAPGMLLVTAEPCALEILRGAFSRSVLKPPATYVPHKVEFYKSIEFCCACCALLYCRDGSVGETTIQPRGLTIFCGRADFKAINCVPSSVLKSKCDISIFGRCDIDDCIVTPTVQGQFTPLPEALCDVIMDLTSQGHSATIENMKVNLSIRFCHMQPPTTEMVYDSLAQLMQERKIYQTAKGYFIVTPERRRSRSRPKANREGLYDGNYDHQEPEQSRTLLMSNAEAVNNLYGEILTVRDGDRTHQCIQTNLADVICGGNPNDKVLYPRPLKRRSASFPTPRSLERRHSLRFFGSSKRLQRCASTRSLSKNYAQTLTTDSSSSEYQSTDSSSPKKASLLSRLFRRSGRSKQRQIETFSDQFPPAEWFNSKAVHLHSIGTQTTMPVAHTLSNSIFYDGSELSQRSLTLPRRHRRHMSSESAFVISSRDCSPIRRGSPVYCSSSLPRSTHSIPNTSKTQRTIPSKFLLNENNRMIAAQSSEVFANPKTKSVDRHCRSVNSGPSSFESGKASSILSGPSSIDSEKASFSRSSGHSSLDSHTSYASTTTGYQPMNRLIHMKGSPKFSPKHLANKSKLRNETLNRIKTSNDVAPLNESDGMPVLGKPPRSSVPNSNSSITLQVTTSNESHSPSTKIYVQNSPVRSVITLENGQLTDNSKVFIINNESTTNSNGELINRTISHSGNQGKKVQSEKGEMAYETGDTLSLISDTSPDSELLPSISSISDVSGNSKFIKNVNNDVTMNNSRKLQLQVSHPGDNIVYKNVLKDVDSTPTSPIKSKNSFNLESPTDDDSYYNRSFDSTSMNSKLNSNPAINTDSLAHILHKNIITVGSEPNLVFNNNEYRQKALAEKSIEKEPIKDLRRFSIAKESIDESFSFPSLSDLSFNFTSVAAQKILQGVSLNSIDTLVELNLAQEKQQNNVTSTVVQTPALCTDYGMI